MLLRALDPSGVHLFDGEPGPLRALVHELLHEAVHDSEKSALLLDGGHVYNPYDAADLNMTRGHPAAYGAERTLIRRTLTPYQWHHALTEDLDAKLAATPARMLVAAPFERLFVTDELEEWERRDYCTHAMACLRATSRRFRVPIAITADVADLWRHHPQIGTIIVNGSDQLFRTCLTPSGWELTDLRTRARLVEPRGRLRTLDDYLAPEKPMRTAQARA